jgi:hypothetical protein
MADLSKIERKLFDPRTMDRNWDRSNDKYIGMLTEQQEIEAANVDQSSDWSFLRSIFRAVSNKKKNVGG